MPPIILICFLSLFSVGCNCIGSCVISNSGAHAKTDLSVVEPYTWEGPATPTGTRMYNWSLSLCKQAQGVCKKPEYSAYLQQNNQAGCSHNAYFQEFTSSLGGQGEEPIWLTYQGNPTVHYPIMGRQGHVEIKCNLTGSYNRLSSCSVDVQNAGTNWVYTVLCYGKIACAGAPGPAPTPGAPAPVPTPPNPQCVIESATGLKTNLAVVQEYIWVGPNKPTGHFNFTWSLSLCKLSPGVCGSKYSAYLQQGGQGGCSKNAWFSTFEAGTGGQGGGIFLTYKGNPTVEPPIMGRVGHIVILCDPTGSYHLMSSCSVDIEGAGPNYVYTVECWSKIACKGAPGPAPVPAPPVPSPPPPPASCGCDFGMWQGNTQCVGRKGIEGAVGASHCTQFTGASGEIYSVALGGQCRDYNLFKGNDCVNGLIGSYHVNHCNATKMDSSVLMFCPPQ